MGRIRSRTAKVPAARGRGPSDVRAVITESAEEER